jgi:hypothetical protein
MFCSVAEAYFYFTHLSDDVVAGYDVSVFAPDGACASSPSSGSYLDDGSGYAFSNFDDCV